MADVKKMRQLNDHIGYSIRADKNNPCVQLWLSKEDAEMLHHWLDNKILWEQTHGKEGTP